MNEIKDEPCLKKLYSKENEVEASNLYPLPNNGMHILIEKSYAG